MTLTCDFNCSLVSALKEYDPNEQTISTLTDEIKELVNGIDYKKANYTRVDHYLNSIPKDLSIYTEDSVKNLQFVIDMIQRELPKSFSQYDKTAFRFHHKL